MLKLFEIYHKNAQKQSLKKIFLLLERVNAVALKRSETDMAPGRSNIFSLGYFYLSPVYRPVTGQIRIDYWPCYFEVKIRADSRPGEGERDGEEQNGYIFQRS